MVSIENIINYKAKDLFKLCNFDINFVFIQKLTRHLKLSATMHSLIMTQNCTICL